jgi:uncharacterized repeat protein (TIGR03803 family)
MKYIGVTCIFVLASTIAFAQNFSTLLQFNGFKGASPQFGSLIQATNGKLYGTTTYGGLFYNTNTGCPPPYGCGTIFDMWAKNDQTIVHSFDGGDGGLPTDSLLQASDGNFYGTTIDGGSGSCGTVFRISAGTLTTLYDFDCDANGGYPQSGLVEGLNKTLYGITSSTIFKVNSAGALTTIYTFCSQPNCADGFAPYGSLAQGPDGDFYGTTAGGGANNGGTVFKITPDGDFTTLYSFCVKSGCADGAHPNAGLTLGLGGEFYGVTSAGGANNLGTVFAIASSGSLITLHSFDGNDGASPTGTLIYASDHNLYGTAESGGTHTNNGQNIGGTIFQITPRGAFTLLYSFCDVVNCADGEVPMGGLVQDTNGGLYGMTDQGGDLYCITTTFGCGTVFGFSLNLPAFVETQVPAAAVGQSVVILGSNLRGATNVTFNGTRAEFTVVNPSEIKATVPAGATSGNIQVSTPNRTLKTILPFRIVS